MPKYIDCEAANLALAEQGFDWDKAKQALASVPAADVAPVVHGRWEHLGGDEFGCTNCGFIISTEGELGKADTEVLRKLRRTHGRRCRQWLK